MGIFDGINIAEKAMSVHRYRSEVAAENIVNVHTPGYRRKEVVLRGSNFASALAGAGAGVNRGTAAGGSRASTSDANDGAVAIASIKAVPGKDYDERQQALLATTDMLQSKSAFELSVKAATMLKSMALASLEIGRGS